jgi:hypothetical protein
MRGVTLLEFLAGVSLFMLLLFFSYHAFDAQKYLLNDISARTQPEEESNYRMLLVKHFLERSTQKLKVDPLLEGATIFFPDLSFGESPPQTNAFSVAHVTGLPIFFVRESDNHKVAPTAAIAKQKTYLMTGSDSNGNFLWSYAIAEAVWQTAEGFTVKFKRLTAGAELEKGTLIEVELHGFLFQNQTLYWISPGGAMQPYLSTIDSFEYNWNKPALTIAWKNGIVQTEFRCVL